MIISKIFRLFDRHRTKRTCIDAHFQACRYWFREIWSWAAVVRPWTGRHL